MKDFIPKNISLSVLFPASLLTSIFAACVMICTDPAERLLSRLGAHRHGRSESPQVTRRGRWNSGLPGAAAARSHWTARKVCLWKGSSAVVKGLEGVCECEREKKSKLPKGLNFHINFLFYFIFFRKKRFTIWKCYTNINVERLLQHFLLR